MLVDPASYFDFLSALKPPGHVVTALIGGDPSATLDTGPITEPFMQDLALLPSCHATINGNAAIGRPAGRVATMVVLFADHGSFATCASRTTARR